MSQAGQTPLYGDVEAQLVLPENLLWNQFLDGSYHKSVSRYPRKLIYIVIFMFCTSILLTYSAGVAIGLFQLLRCIFFRLHYGAGYFSFASSDEVHPYNLCRCGDVRVGCVSMVVAPRLLWPSTSLPRVFIPRV